MKMNSIKQMVEKNIARQNQIRYKQIPDEVNKLRSLFECHAKYILSLSTKKRLILTILFLKLVIGAHKKVKIWAYRSH